MALEINPFDIRRYFELLGGYAHYDLRAISDRRVHATADVSSYSDFEAFCRRWNGLANVVCGIQERVPNGKKGKDVLRITKVVIDIDANHPPGLAATYTELKECQGVARIIHSILVERYGLCSVIMTGNGFHFMWNIEPIPLSDENREETQQKVLLWARSIKAEFSTSAAKIDVVSDFARVQKVPGTLSTKGDNSPTRPYRIARFTDYTPLVSTALRRDILSIKVPEIEFRGEQGDNAPPFDEVLIGDIELARLYYGHISNYPSRSEAEMALVHRLVRYGFGDNDIHKILKSAKIGKWIEANRQYRTLTIKKARTVYNYND